MQEIEQAFKPNAGPGEVHGGIHKQHIQGPSYVSGHALWALQPSIMSY